MRLFIALNLPDEALDAVEALIRRAPVGRRMWRETLHVTVAFLGELSEVQAEAVHEGLEALSETAFDLELKGLDTFGRPQPSVLFAGAEGGAGLEHLHRAVRGVVRMAGIDLPRERYRPHVTMLRFPRLLDGAATEKLAGFVAANMGFAFGPFPVRSFTLFQSRLGPDGAQHEALAHYLLRGA